MDFNSVEYAWKDIEVSYMGRIIGRLLEVKYSVEVEKKHIYGRGNNPLGVQIGNKKVSAEIKVGQSELEAMTRKAQELRPGADITDISFNINVAYVKDVEVVRDRIRDFSITKMEKGMKQGDTDMEVSLPGLAMGIEYNV